MNDLELRSAIAVHHTATDDGSWDGPAAEKALGADPSEAQLHALYAWVDPDGDPKTKSAYKFPHHEVSSEKVGAANTHGCSAGIAALNGGRGGTTIPEADRHGVWSHLGAHLKDAKKDVPELKSEGPDPTRLIRSSFGAGTIELRESPDAPGTGSELHGHFSKFNQWYEVNDFWEGTFLEKVAPGAFAKTIEEDGPRMRVLFDHGFDPAMGDKPLGPIIELEEDEVGARYRVALLDTDYNRSFILPALQGKLMDGRSVGSQLGASFQFIVNDETWDRSGKVLTSNPKGLPRRTIREAQVFEFGPVTFPASPTASAGVRAGTSDYYERLLNDGGFVAQLMKRASPRVVQHMLDDARRIQETIGSGTDSEEMDQARSERLKLLRRRAAAFTRIGVV